MAKRGGWRTILKYAVGILALSASIAIAWFLPGLYAGWQDAQTQERLSRYRGAAADAGGDERFLLDMGHRSGNGDARGGVDRPLP